MKNNMGEVSVSGDKPERRYQGRHLFAGEYLELIEKIRNEFSLFTDVDKKESVLWLASLLFLFC